MIYKLMNWTHRNFSAEKSCVQKVLRTTFFTYRRLYAQMSLHTQIAHRNLCTQHAFTHSQLLHREALPPLLDHQPFVFPLSSYAYIKLTHLEMNAGTHVHRQRERAREREREESFARAHIQTYTNALHTCIDVPVSVHTPSFRLSPESPCVMPPLELEASSDISDESDGGWVGRYCLGMGRIGYDR